MTVDSPVGAHAELTPTAEIPADLQVKPQSRKQARQARREAKQNKPKRRGLVYWLIRGFRKTWMVLLIALVVGVGAFSVVRLHGMFGKTELTREGSGLVNDPKPFNPKTVTYEVFGPPGATATINYLDLDAEPQIARDVPLPWTLTLTTTAPAAAANLVAQGPADNIGCRVTVDGVVKAERWSSGVSAQTFCIVKSG